MWSGKGSNCRPSAFQLVCRSDEGAQIILIWIYPDQDGAGAPFPVGISAPGWCQGQRPGRHRPCLAWPRTHSGPGRVTKRLDELCPGRPRRVPKYLAEVLVSGARAEEQLRGGLCVGGSHGDQPGDPLLLRGQALPLVYGGRWPPGTAGRLQRPYPSSATSRGAPEMPGLTTLNPFSRPQPGARSPAEGAGQRSRTAVNQSATAAVIAARWPFSAWVSARRPRRPRLAHRRSRTGHASGLPCTWAPSARAARGSATRISAAVSSPVPSAAAPVALDSVAVPVPSAALGPLAAVGPVIF
jgi:hypothetical protein